MKKIIILILCIISVSPLFSQNPMLMVDIQFKDTSIVYDFEIKEKINDSIVKKINSKEQFKLTGRNAYAANIQPIDQGIYQFILLNSVSKDTIDADFFYLEKEFTYYIKYNGEEFIQSKSNLPKPPKIDTIRYKSNFGIMGSFFKNNWYNPVSQVKGGYSLGAEWNNHYVVAKNISLFFGLGIQFERYNLFKDSMISTVDIGKVKKQYYNNLDVTGNVGVRFTSNSQYFTRDLDLFFVELGARYNFPIVFMHRVENDQHQAFNSRRIHQYADFRAYAAIGFSMVSIFAEYKLFDFIKNPYPEVGKLNVGIKLNIFMDSDL